MLTDKKLSYKVSVHCNNQTLLDQNGVKILETINLTHSLSETAKNLNVSYRYVYNYLRRIQNLLKQPAVETFKGGKDGGGGAKLTKLGENLLNEYYQVERYLADILSSGVALQTDRSTNEFKGKVIAVEEASETVNVKVAVQTPVIVTTVMPKSVAKELGLKIGAEVAPIIKCTEIKMKK